MSRVLRAPQRREQRPEVITPTGVVEGRVATAIAVPHFAAKIVRRDRQQSTKICHVPLIEIPVIVAQQHVVEGVMWCVPDIADTGVVIRFVPQRLSCKDPFHAGADVGELSHAVAAGQILVTRYQIQPDEGRVILPRDSVGIDLLLQIEKSCKMT